MSIAHTPDREKTARIDWTPEKVAEFVELWNTRHPNYVADRFGIKRGYACVVATHLRRAGHELKYYNARQHAHVTERDRSAMDAFAKALASKYKMAVSQVVGTGRKRDGRIDARNALAWAGIALLSMSYKQVALYLSRPSHSTAIWMSRRAKDEDKRFCTALFKSREMRSA